MRNLRAGVAEEDADDVGDGDETDVLISFEVWPVFDCCNCCNGWTVAVWGMIIGEP